jgi:outer membrane lipoprotein-sorting protein
MRRSVARVLLVASVTLLAPGILSAQTGPSATLPSVVPLPPLPPLPKEGAKAQEKAQETTTASLGSTKQVAPPPSLTQPAQAMRPSTRPGSAGPINLDGGQRAIVQRVNSYFNSISTLVGNFVQVGPDRQRLEGDFYLQKPGKVRFDYDPPSPVELISDGSSIVVRDRKLATQDLYPLSQTPLRFLLSDKLDLIKDTTIVGVYQDDLFLTVAIEEKHPLVGTHRLMLMFGAKDSELKQWTITDPQGYDTTIAIFNLDQKQKPDPALFKIDYHVPRN